MTISLHLNEQERTAAATGRAARLGRMQPRHAAALVLFAALAAVPFIATFAGGPYLVTIASRIVIMALAAIGLNLVLGYGGLVSFGHALYIGLGAYAVGIATQHGLDNGLAHIAIALGAGGLLALVLGAISLRTSGMAFIMITLAFAQMAYVSAVSLRGYGGEDGLQIAGSSRFGPFDLSNATVLYYVAFVLLAAVALLTSRLVVSRFGMVLRATKFNEQRMVALGFKTFRFKLIAYVISAMICVIAGILQANLTHFVSPAYMQWTVSGELIVMVVLGGMATVIGPIVGAVVLLLIEDQLSGIDLGLPGGADAFVSAHWLAFLGLFIVATALVMKRGLYGTLVGEGDKL
jgi:branched-chain amino acid transport system permease protein